MPVVCIVVVFQEMDCAFEALGRRVVQVIFQVHKCAIDPVGPAILADIFWNFRVVDQRMPDIAFLAAHKFPTVETRVIAFAAAVEVMVVVGNHVRISAFLSAQFGLETVVPRLNRRPRGFQEIDASGIHFATCGHTGHRAAIVIVEDYAARRQTVDVRRLDPGVFVVAFEVVAIEGIEGNEDRSHSVLQ